MSWQAYIDSSLLSGGSLDKAAIYGNTAAGAPWATSPGFSLSAPEVTAIIKSFTDSKEPKEVMTNGFKVQGEKYTCFKADERSLYGRSGKHGVIIVKTKQAILVGHYPDGVAIQSAGPTVEKLGDYLIGVGY